MFWVFALEAEESSGALSDWKLKGQAGVQKSRVVGEGLRKRKVVGEIEEIVGVVD